MSAVLADTVVWTGALIAAVLLLRRPVSRHFGPEVAYALWALPLVRLVLPPLTLPPWMAPPAASVAAARVADVPFAAAAPQTTAPLTQMTALPLAATSAPVEAAPQAGFDLLAALAAVAWLEVLLFVWLAGAAVTLALRFAAYFALRDELLAEAREVGRAPGPFGGLVGKIRLIETPATAAPLALGVLDPVIALPPGFMALHDRAARDLALAHELAHHLGGDLLVNVLVQPLFALHWWNPLGRYGWLALRRDQEAACDARVMARRNMHERAAYAALIARIAGQPGAAHTAALTAPMACPVLGEKSIIHRLRSLTMSELSLRRRLAGRALLGAGLLAIPLTASVSYAASETASAQAPEAPEPPAPPAPPPGRPDLPPPPPPPGGPGVIIIDTRTGTITDSADGEVTERVWRGPDGKENRVRMVWRGGPGGGFGGPDPEVTERRIKALRSADKAEREAAIAELQAEAEAQKARREAWHAMAGRSDGHIAMLRAPLPPMPPRVMIVSGCNPGSKDMVETKDAKDGKQIITICQTRIDSTARAGLETARDEIAKDTSIPEETRKTVLDTLDAQIARWRDKTPD
jgi:beta-lactamase regulating signal transducer with metallopeptidase domain